MNLVLTWFVCFESQRVILASFHAQVFVLFDLPYTELMCHSSDIQQNWDGCTSAVT